MLAGDVMEEIGARPRSRVLSLSFPACKRPILEWSMHPDRPANPLLAPWTAPYGLPPFAEIQAQHFAPAFEQRLQEHRDTVASIAESGQAPDFDNTVAAF